MEGVYSNRNFYPYRQNTRCFLVVKGDDDIFLLHCTRQHILHEGDGLWLIRMH
jgi:hypothetical protein